MKTLTLIHTGLCYLSWQQIVKAEPEDSVISPAPIVDVPQPQPQPQPIPPVAVEPEVPRPRNNDHPPDDEEAIKRRLDTILQDKNVKVIEPLRVFCAGCKKWVIFEKEYDLGAWRNHRRNCKDVPCVFIFLFRKACLLNSHSGMMPLLFTE